jgi:rod shape determining protein RodA
VIAALREWLEELFDKIDWPLLAALCGVMVASLVVQASAGGGELRPVFKQAANFVAGLGALLLISRVPPNRLRNWTPLIFGFTLALLPLVFVLGSGRSARLWINLGVFYLQPGELLKLTVPMMLAWYLHSARLPPRWLGLFVCAVIIGAPVALIILQPDFGTGMLVLASGAFTVFLAGIAWWRIGLIVGLGLSVLPVGWVFLKPYQVDRIRVFLDPEMDPLGAGWNIIQSKIAIGSGGWFGKGFGQGSQAHLDFLPERTTDFAFSVLSEEWGWIGVCVVFALYLFIVGRSLVIAAEARDTYSRLLAGALAMTFSVYVLVNGAMIAGLLPVVGVPMPLLSYGGTSAVSLLAAFGIVMSGEGAQEVHGVSGGACAACRAPPRTPLRMAMAGPRSEFSEQREPMPRCRNSHPHVRFQPPARSPESALNLRSFAPLLTFISVLALDACAQGGSRANSPDTTARRHHRAGETSCRFDAGPGNDTRPGARAGRPAAAR